MRHQIAIDLNERLTEQLGLLSSSAGKSKTYAGTMALYFGLKYLLENRTQISSLLIEYDAFRRGLNQPKPTLEMRRFLEAMEELPSLVSTPEALPEIDEWADLQALLDETQ